MHYDQYLCANQTKKKNKLIKSKLQKIKQRVEKTLEQLNHWSSATIKLKTTTEILFFPNILCIAHSYFYEYTYVHIYVLRTY